ncbi:MAG: hypothetical protein INR62_12660, partial [Rhodospirillales bacterium]|nr:hypothetical protein [Acetobacter sp.]
MKTIIYQAQPIHVEVMGFMNDERPWGHRDEVTVTLCRDEAGIYYLQRESHHNHDKRTSSPDYARKHAQEYDYRSLVHRVGITAAVLWVLHHAPNGDGWNLRCDAADALMEDRGYSDPNPVYWRYAQHKQAAADTVGEKTVVPVVPAPADTTKRGNVPVDTEVPDDFPALAVRLGRSPKTLLWELAEDLCARSPSTLRVVEEKEPAAEVLASEAGVHRFSFDYPATRKMCGRRR